MSQRPNSFLDAVDFIENVIDKHSEELFKLQYEATKAWLIHEILEMQYENMQQMLEIDKLTRSGSVRREVQAKNIEEMQYENMQQIAKIDRLTGSSSGVQEVVQRKKTLARPTQAVQRKKASTRHTQEVQAKKTPTRPTGKVIKASRQSVNEAIVKHVHNVIPGWRNKKILLEEKVEFRGVKKIIKIFLVKCPDCPNWQSKCTTKENPLSVRIHVYKQHAFKHYTRLLRERDNALYT